uniref:Uncharacterized protein n=1 Tax=Mus spicilegus TaxID=10103 RepID=A0A8C6G5V5_MUSSI
MCYKIFSLSLFVIVLDIFFIYI